MSVISSGKLFVLKTLKFLFLLFGHLEETVWLEKVRLTSKFMTAQPGFQTNTISILPNIPQSKGNHTMKFSELIEYIKGNI